MPVKLPPNASVSQVVEAWRKEVLEPAAKALSGRDGRISANEVTKTAKLEGHAALGADDVGDIFSAASGGTKKTVSVKAFVAAGEAYVRAAVERAAGANAKLSASEMRLLGSLQKDFELGRSGRIEIGVVSDLDSTVIPPGTLGQEAPPYPGVAALFHELEFGKRGTAGDVNYVSARSPDRIATIPDYLDAHGLPAGPIHTGVGTVPWVARDEKVKDIEETFAAHPGQKFVLFGDTRHVDPDVYRELLTKHPEQVQTVFIHKVRNINPDRVQGMNLIDNYAEAAAILYGQGVFSRAAAMRVMKAAKAEGLDLGTAQMNALLDAQRPG